MSIAPKFWIEFRRFTMTFFLRHRHSAFGKVDSDDHRQHLRRKPNGHRKTRKEALETSRASVSPTIKKTIVTMTTMKRIISHVNPAIPRSKLV